MNLSLIRYAQLNEIPHLGATIMYQKDQNNDLILPLLDSVISDIIGKFPEQLGDREDPYYDGYWEAMLWLHKTSMRDGWWSLTNGDQYSLTTRENSEDLSIQFMLRWNERCWKYGYKEY